MPVQSRKPRQDALQTLYPDDPTTDSADSIAAGPDEEPLGDELYELAAVMCDMDLASIDIIGRVGIYNASLPQARKELRTEIASMCSDAKFKKEQEILRHIKHESQLGSDNLFSKGYLCNTSVVRYLDLAAEIAAKPEGWGEIPYFNLNFDRLLDLAKEFCMLSIQAAGETELGEDVLTAMKNRLVQLDRLTLYIAGPKRIKSWRTMMAEIQKARKERMSKTVRHSQRDSDWTSTLVAITGVTILIAMIPTYMAWSRSPYSPGSTSDSDFWWLVQSSIMALLSLLTLSIPIYKNSKSSQKGQTWFWTCWFISAATVATLLAPVLYVFVPTAYSGATVFVASACQAFVVLQLSLAASVGMGKEKEKEKTS